jgi:hypothetical protein
MTSTWRVGRAWRLCGKAASTMMLAVVLGGASTAYAAGRVALVIGVGEYTHVTPLANPTKDAALIAQTLRQVGFDVTEVTQANQENQAGLTTAIQAFKAKADNAEAAIIYYAGHGVELDGKNYLLPVEVEATTADELKHHAIPNLDAMTSVSGASRVRLVILDACRDNPFATRSLGMGATRGLSRESRLPNNVTVLMATQPGERASDGTGANSPFATALASAIATKGLVVPLLPSRLANTMKSAGIAQNPDMQGIIRDETWAFIDGPPAAIPICGQNVTKFGVALQARGCGLPGVVVAQVDKQSPYYNILRTQDVLTQMNGQDLRDPEAIFGAVEDLRNDHDRVTINYTRGRVQAMLDLKFPRDLDD